MAKLQLLILLFFILRVEAQPDFDIREFERSRVLLSANRYLKEQPITITSSSSPRSAGGRNDFFSEGDYWWPDPKNPRGAYIQRDGMTNPDNFVEHRRALMRLSVQVPSLAAAWVITGKKVYSDKAAEHIRAWFINENTQISSMPRPSRASLPVEVSGSSIRFIWSRSLVQSRSCKTQDR